VSVRLYMDVQIHQGVTKGLRSRKVDVITAREDARHTLSDPRLLDRATQLGRALVTHDADFLVEAARRQSAGIEFAGIVYSHALNVTVGQLVEQLQFLCEAGDDHYMRNRVEYLPV
jgi:predicted nuclease of predicted toxin-antitoxin system